MKRFILSLAAGFLGLAGAWGQLRLPEIVGDNMVLQQDADVAIWGWAEAKSDVTVAPSWCDSVFTARAGKDGAWKAVVRTPKGGMNEYSMSITAKRRSESETVVLNGILCGEVWFCSGQSNMEMPLDGFWDCPVEGSAEEIALSGKLDGVRIVKVPKTGALEPAQTVGGRWEKSNPQNARWFSATAFHFAKMLNGVLDVPVGIINCSWGGSMVECWLPKEIVSAYEDMDCNVSEPAEGNKGWNWSTNIPFIMYNGMVNPLVNYTVKGFLWYQGESNVGKENTYAERMETLIRTWRELWGLGELPFYMVELAPYRYGGDGTVGARLREAQMKAAKTVPNCGIVCTNDLVYPHELDQIHPCRKQEVGQRLAYLALNRTYGFDGIDCEGPVFREMKVEGNVATLYFDNDRNGFSPWTELVGFEIAGQDRVFYPAQAKIKPGGKYVTVSAPQVSEPVAVRYCFKDFQVGNLTGSRNLPAFPFRTDDWGY